MKPHIEIRTDKPQELLELLDKVKTRFAGLADLHSLLRSAHFRLVETEHQGFANFETFTIGIWIDCDKHLSFMMLAAARQALLTPDPARLVEFGLEAAAELDLADVLKTIWDTNSPEIPEPWNSLSNVALGNVDWLDLARHYISKVREGVTV